MAAVSTSPSDTTRFTSPIRSASAAESELPVKRMKKLSYLFIAIAILLSDIMCFVVAYNYRDMLCGIEHAAYSAPANVAFLSAIPFGIGIIICAVVAYTLHKKAR